MVKTCVQCGREFVPRHGLEKLCSDECRRKHTKERNRDNKRKYHGISTVKKCIVCGKEFEPENLLRQFCSEECRTKKKAQHNARYYQKYCWGKKKEYAHQYYLRRKDELNHRRRNRHPNHAADNLNYLARLEEDYGRLGSDTLKRTIISWSDNNG